MSIANRGGQAAHNTDYKRISTPARSNLTVDGNTVRKTTPQRRINDTPDERKEHVKKHSRQVLRNQQKAMLLDVRYLLFLCVAVAICVCTCVVYLNMRAKVNNVSSEITTLKTQIEDLTTKNDALDFSINSHIDIDKICKRAKKELGMVQAGQNQISTYSRSNSGYMKQSGNIPSK